MLCCIGCAIFGVTEVSTDGINFDAAAGDFAYMSAEAGKAPGTTSPAAAPNPTAYVPPPVVVPALAEATSSSAPQVPAAAIPPPIVVISSEPVIAEARKDDTPQQADLPVVASDSKAVDVPTEGEKPPPGEINELD